MNSTTKLQLICVVILGVGYFSLFPPATKGYGYAGYGGYNSGPSFWYFGGPNFYGEPRNLAGSIGGSNPLGGGPGSGK